jgi:hypothetical protein
MFHRMLDKDGLVCEVEDEKRRKPKKNTSKQATQRSGSRRKSSRSRNRSGKSSDGEDSDSSTSIARDRFQTTKTDGSSRPSLSPTPRSVNPGRRPSFSPTRDLAEGRLPSVVTSLELHRLPSSSSGRSPLSKQMSQASFKSEGDDGANDSVSADDASAEGSKGLNITGNITEPPSTGRSMSTTQSRKDITQHQRTAKISGKLDRTFSMIAPELEGIKLSSRLATGRDQPLTAVTESSLREHSSASNASLVHSLNGSTPIPEEGYAYSEESPLMTVRSRLSSPSPTMPTPRPAAISIPAFSASFPGDAVTETALTLVRPDVLALLEPVESPLHAASATTTPNLAANGGLPSVTPTSKGRNNIRVHREEPIERGQLAIVNPRSSALDKYYVRC